MNERIKELANRLGPVATIGNWGRVEWADNVYPQLGDKMYASIDLEKFAELIVRECEKVAKDSQWYSESPSNGWRNPIRHVCNVMKEHFGVEE